MSVGIKIDDALISEVKYQRAGSNTDSGTHAMVKVKGVALANPCLPGLLGASDVSDLWSGEDKDLAFPHLGKFNVKTKLEGAGAVVGGVNLNNVNLNGIKCQVLAGGAVDIELRLVCCSASTSDESQLKGMLKTNQEVVIEGGDIVTTAATGQMELDEE